MENNKIPKIIHYCWFGRGEKPKIVKACIESWKAVMPEYEIKEWNEDNFDINCNDFVRDAYEAKKYAFVSDYVRVYALNKYGGIYLDTDVKTLKSFDEFLYEDSFWGFEEKNFVATSTIGAAKNNEIIKMFLDSYADKKFKIENGQGIALTNVRVVSEILGVLGFKMDGSKQTIEGLGTVYPQEYFSPYDYINCVDTSTKDTVVIHYFYKSWLPFSARIKQYIKKVLVKFIGRKNLNKLREIKSAN